MQCLQCRTHDVEEQFELFINPVLDVQASSYQPHLVFRVLCRQKPTSRCRLVACVDVIRFDVGGKVHTLRWRHGRGGRGRWRHGFCGAKARQHAVGCCRCRRRQTTKRWFRRHVHCFTTHNNNKRHLQRNKTQLEKKLNCCEITTVTLNNTVRNIYTVAHKIKPQSTYQFLR